MTSEIQSPLVSVVTPFYNSADDLEQCIQSVLRQTFADFEYVLLDNCSTDSSLAIAQRYAACDSRIRVVRADRFRTQVENYNYGLSLIAAGSQYCKLVQADDWIYPTCLEAMVEVAQRRSQIGIVAAYSLRGTVLRGDGLAVDQWYVPGRAAGRLQMLNDLFFTGSPTTIMYRAQLVRSRQPFYELNRYHEDTEVAYELFKEHDLGFVHQVLSYQRVDPQSVMGRRSSYAPHLMDRLIILERYGRDFLSPEEFTQTHARCERELVRFLGHSMLRGREREFWKYQEGGFRSVGRALPRIKILAAATNQILDVILNPKRTLESVARKLRNAGRRP